MRAPSHSATSARRMTSARWCTACFALVAVLPFSLKAQDPFQAPPGTPGARPSASPEQMKEAMERARAAREAARAQAAGGGPAGAAKPGEAKPDDAKPGEEGKSESAGKLENVQRTAEPPAKPNPDELKVKPDDQGLLYFQFRNQPWPDVLRWYADVCNLSFDWQELPGDYINLATQRPHSLEETGDMINRALLMRGFTMLQDDETLTVAKVEGLNPSLVPRVQPHQLTSLPPHRYVRTSFPLSWLLAEQVHEEFSSMISKNGRLTPLQSTNRLEGMDAAANLRDIYEILEQEQSAIALQNLAREFPLQFARAAAVKMQLEAFLGLQNGQSSAGGDSSSAMARMMQQQMQQQMQQMQQQMQRQMQQQGNPGAAGGNQRKPRSEDVYLVANERSNSVIVHAPPNKMAIIESFIARVDVRNESAADYQRLNTRMKVFRLASLGPTELVASLTAMDVLEPTTRLQVDEENNAIIAYASVADQYMIQSVIDRLDGSERRFEVVQLRRLDAESVAGSIKFLMGADEEEEDDSSRRNRYIFGYYDPYSRNREKKSSDKMRVGANVQDNQLLLWVNDIEMEEVQNLLVKLGEVPPKGGRPSTMRVIDASRQPETYEYLKQLKEQWDRISPNPLLLPEQSEFQSPEDEAAETSDSQQPEAGAEQPAPKADPASPNSDKITRNSRSNPRFAYLTSRPDENSESPNATAAAVSDDVIAGSAAENTDVESNGSSTANEPPASSESTQLNPQSRLEQAQQPQPPPVRIYLDEAGNLVLQSEDTAALDRLEELMQTNRPPRRPYDIFKVKHARASWVSLNLEEYFDKEEDNRPRFFSFFDMGDEKERQLGDKPPLRFIWDNDTNSIVVQGADDIDRQTIKELIELWDVPEQVDKSTIRFTRLVKVRFSRAENIVNTIKEAYRDLLSATDKTFQQNQQGEEGGENKRSGGSQGVQGDGFDFGGLRGKLSLGPDSLTNSILISAEGEDLMKIVEDVIRELDEAAKDQGNVEVYRVSGDLNGNSLKKALSAIFNRAAQPESAKPEAQPPQAQPAAEPPQQPIRGGFDRGSSSRRRDR